MRIQPLLDNFTLLTFSNSEHFGAARGTYSLSRRLAILHGYRLGILHFLLGAALNTVRLHSVASIFDYER